MYNPSEAEIEVAVIESIRGLLEEQTEWETRFGITMRRNGSVVIGNPRDVIDTGEFYRGIDVSFSSNRISIKFTDDDARFIFGDRWEMDDLMVDGIFEQLAGLIVQNLLSKII
jgi:hypothetical protein